MFIMSELNNRPYQDVKTVKPDEEPAPFGEKLILYLVMATIVIADQISKYVVESNIPIRQFWAPFPEKSDLLRIAHVSNTGAAFGIFPNGSSIIMVVAIVVSIVILIYNQKLPAHHVWYRLALGLQLGGALGNLVDRFRIGHVTDFIDVGPVPVFNIADASIVVGTILLGFLILIEEKEERASKRSEEVPEDQSDQPLKESAEEQPMLWNE
ncbi:MAG: signal peptidase II [Anaerolineae bacterium]|nr:MAG: signal peptidase II [Anaerolineae bacterium]